LTSTTGLETAAAGTVASTVAAVVAVAVSRPAARKTRVRVSLI
jgi:hypothetical protein